MIDLVLVRKDMQRYMQDVRTVRGMGQVLSDHYVVLCKIKLVRTWIKRSDVVNEVRKIRSEKLREHQYREGYARSLEGKRVKWNREINVKQVKWLMVESER